VRPINAAGLLGSAAWDAAYESTNEMITAANGASVLQKYEFTNCSNSPELHMHVPAGFSLLEGSLLHVVLGFGLCRFFSAAPLPSYVV
jgi:hypothetical protein